jgi:hypothetical protein
MRSGLLPCDSGKKRNCKRNSSPILYSTIQIDESRPFLDCLNNVLECDSVSILLSESVTPNSNYIFEWRIMNSAVYIMYRWLYICSLFI